MGIELGLGLVKDFMPFNVTKEISLCSVPVNCLVIYFKELREQREGYLALLIVITLQPVEILISLVCVN